MTQKQVKQLIKDFKYKNVQFTIDRFFDGQVYITGERPLVDPITGKEDLVMAEEAFNYKTSNEIQFLLALRDWMHLAECHEADEHMIYKGKQIFHPHAAKETLY